MTQSVTDSTPVDMLNAQLLVMLNTPELCHQRQLLNFLRIETPGLKLFLWYNKIQLDEEDEHIHWSQVPEAVDTYNRKLFYT